MGILGGTKMVTVQLQGGIGNQMFQVATAYAAAKENKDSLILSASNWAALSGKHPHEYRDTIFKEFKWTDEHLDYPIYKETDEYSPIKYSGDIKLYGYFQDPRYFDKYQKELEQLFFNHDVAQSFLENKSIDMSYFPDLGETIAVHVRRGDYVRLSNMHPPVTTEYISQAIDSICKKKFVEMIWVFSDDMQWCMDNLRDKRIKFVETGSDVQNIYMMSIADNHVISNSTYSWWGAYFSTGEVRAPKIWFGNGRRKGVETHIYTPNMIKL
jgi:hypothetical protein